MTMSTDLWHVAAVDPVAEELGAAVAAVKTAMADRRGFVMAASTKDDYDNRIELTREVLDRTIAANVPSRVHQAIVANEVLGEWEGEFTATLAERAQRAHQARAARLVQAQRVAAAEKARDAADAAAFFASRRTAAPVQNHRNAPGDDGPHCPKCGSSALEPGVAGDQMICDQCGAAVSPDEAIGPDEAKVIWSKYKSEKDIPKDASKRTASGTPFCARCGNDAAPGESFRYGDYDICSECKEIVDGLGSSPTMAQDREWAISATGSSQRTAAEDDDQDFDEGCTNCGRTRHQAGGWLNGTNFCSEECKVAFGLGVPKDAALHWEVDGLVHTAADDTIALTVVQSGIGAHWAVTNLAGTHTFAQGASKNVIRAKSACLDKVAEVFGVDPETGLAGGSKIPNGVPDTKDPLHNEKPAGTDPADPNAQGENDVESVDPLSLNAGDTVTSSYSMTTGDTGEVEVTFVRTEDDIAYLSGPNGEFGVAQRDGEWIDSEGNAFNFTLGSPAQAAEEAAAQGEGTPQLDEDGNPIPGTEGEPTIAPKDPADPNAAANGNTPAGIPNTDTKGEGEVEGEGSKPGAEPEVEAAAEETAQKADEAKDKAEEVVDKAKGDEKKVEKTEDDEDKDKNPFAKKSRLFERVSQRYPSLSPTEVGVIVDEAYAVAGEA